MNKDDIILFLKQSIQEEIIAEANYTERAAISMQLYRLTGDPRFKANADRWIDVAKDENEHQHEFIAQLDEWGDVTKLEMIQADMSSTMAEMMDTGMDVSKMNMSDMQTMHNSLMKHTMRYTPPHVGVGGGMSRKFPSTYGEWVNLAEDIKTKDQTPETIFKVNNCLNYISSDKAEIIGSAAHNAADGAKRMLVQIAGELGIR